MKDLTEHAISVINKVNASILDVRSMASLDGAPHSGTYLANIAAGASASCGEYASVLRDVLLTRGIEKSRTKQLYFVNNNFETHVVTLFEHEDVKGIADATFGLIPRIDGRLAWPEDMQNVVKSKAWERLNLTTLAFYEKTLSGYYIEYPLLYRGLGNQGHVGNLWDYLKRIPSLGEALSRNLPVMLYYAEKPDDSMKDLHFRNLQEIGEEGEGWLSKVLWPKDVDKKYAESMELYHPIVDWNR